MCFLLQIACFSAETTIFLSSRSFCEQRSSCALSQSFPNCYRTTKVSDPGNHRLPKTSWLHSSATQPFDTSEGLVVQRGTCHGDLTGDHAAQRWISMKPWNRHVHVEDLSAPLSTCAGAHADPFRCRRREETAGLARVPITS